MTVIVVKPELIEQDIVVVSVEAEQVVDVKATSAGGVITKVPPFPDVYGGRGLLAIVIFKV